MSSTTSIETGAVATCYYNGRRWTAAGHSTDNATYRLEKTIDDAVDGYFDIGKSSTVEHITDVPAEGLFYVLFCFNGEDPRNPDWEWTSVPDGFSADEMWGDNWKDKLRNELV